MAVDRLQRRMAAILAADVVGYSRLIGKDEEDTLATLRAYRSVIDGLIAHHEGRVFGSAGDSVIAEFASPVEAVRCATEIQLEIDRRNANLPEASRMRFRIGINLGDVVVDGDNLMGDGVNIAARLEALSPPGGICISEAIHAQVRDRLSLDFLDLGEHSMKNIARPVRAYRVPLASEEQTKSPFRGLDVFDFDHTDLFFGRTRAVAACTERLEQQAANGKAFLLIYGMSGSGKSSLLRAGLLPAITRPGTVAGITVWRRCLFRPSEGSDAIASLAAGLLREDALQELAQEKTATELAELLRGGPDRALALIRAALGKAATAASLAPSQARLALAVDQVEELFTTETQPASREAFVRLLSTFAASGLVWVIGTIRADFFHRCSEVPGFSTLKDGLGSYELLPPTGPEIAQIIREPARAAGLRFEETADQGRLEDVLQAAAIADPGSLPLLEFVLDALYEAGRDRRLLTFAAYRALGGLGGAIARRADEVVDALPPHIQEALPAVLRALTTVRLGEDAVTAAPASLADVAGTPAQSALVDALIAARLLVSDEDADCHAIVRVAHEALLSRWPRARDIVNANRDFLETRARLRTDARRWHSDDKNPELLLPPGKRLAEGEELLQSRREEVDDQITDYIEASSLVWRAEAEKELQAERARIETEEAVKRERLEREAERRSLENVASRERLEREADRRSLEAAAATRLARRTRYAAVVAITLAAIAGASAVIGFSGQREAERQAVLAEENANQAEQSANQAKAAEQQAVEARGSALTALDRALVTQSRFLADLSRQQTDRGDNGTALALALEALPDKARNVDRPYVPQAEAALYEAVSSLREKHVLRGHQNSVWSAAFSPDGTRIVTASDDRTARLWDAASGAEMAVLRGHQDPVLSAVFSPDGKRIVTASRDGTARLWDASSGARILVLQAHKGPVRFATFSNDSKNIVTASDDGTARLWDAASGAENAVLRGHQGPVLSAVFSPDGRRIVTASEDNTARLWDAASGGEIAALRGHEGPVQSAVFSPDGTRIVTASRDGTARLWDATRGVEIAVLRGHESSVWSAAFSPDGTRIVTASLDSAARLWNVASGSEITVLGGHESSVRSAVFSPDGARILTASFDNTVRLWDTASRAEVTLLRGHQRHVRYAAFSPDGKQVVTASDDGTARVWDVASGMEIAVLRGHRAPVQSAVFSPDGTRIVTASSDGTGRLWNAGTGAETAVLRGHRLHVWFAAFSPDGMRVVTASADNTARLWDATSGAEISVLRGHESSVNFVAFSPDGTRIVTASSDRTARLWDATSGSEVAVLRGHENYVNSAAFSPDGTRVVTASNDKTARVWDAASGAELMTLQHDGNVRSAAFSLDGARLVTALDDSTARLWDTVSGAEIAVLRGHEGAVKSAEFSPDGTRIVTASDDNTARIWPVFPTTQALVDYARSVMPRELTNDQRFEFFLK